MSSQIIWSGNWDKYEMQLNRAYQALHGIKAHAISFDEPEEKKISFSKLSNETIKDLNSISISLSKIKDEKEKEYYVSDIIDVCVYEAYESLKKSPVSQFFQVEMMFIWDLYYNFFDIRDGRLRINKHTFLDNFDSAVVAKYLNLPYDYFIELPNFSEVIFEMSHRGDGVNFEFVIPLQLLVKDFIVILVEAEKVKKYLEESDFEHNPLEQSLIVKRDKIDTFVRQLLVLSVTLLEASLNDYGWLVEKLVQDEDLKKEIEKNSRGVTNKILKLPFIWMKIFKREIEVPEAIYDMKKIIEVRNKLIHFNASESAFYAFDLNILVIHQQKNFSDRIIPFLIRDKYSHLLSSIGFEIQLAKFAFATVNEILIFFHEIFYENRFVKWFNLYQFENSMIALDKIVQEMIADENATNRVDGSDQ